MDFQTITSTAPSAEAGGSSSNADNDLALLALETQFNELAAELAALRSVCNAQAITCCSDGQPSSEVTLHPRVRELSDQDATRQAEAILARLYPVEQAIMATPAHTIAGLGVKARHAAHVMSQYWTAPIAEIDWDERVVRLLIESVCSLANVPLPFFDPDQAETRIKPNSALNRPQPSTAEQPDPHTR
jgi:hypothetical protein